MTIEGGYGESEPREVSKGTHAFASSIPEDVDEDSIYPIQEEEEEDLRRSFKRSSSNISANSVAGITQKSRRIDFLRDDPKEMTKARRLALSLLDKQWYNPTARKWVEDSTQHGNGDKASTHSSIADAVGETPDFGAANQVLALKRAWAYFEHVTLMRYVVHDHNKSTDDMSVWQRYRYASSNRGEEFENAKPGEKHRRTKLYDYISTPHMQVREPSCFFISIRFEKLILLFSLFSVRGLWYWLRVVFFYSSGNCIHIVLCISSIGIQHLLFRFRQL
jgi:hypothetical protein